jgi:phospholipid/cholesterol/gamma-HCH transport system substrate-binding protein
VKITKEAKVGLFVAIAITLLYFGYNFLRGKKLFSTYNTYYIIYNNVEGLVPSTAVFVNGFKVGQVEEISMPDMLKTDSILVKILVQGKIQIKSNSTALVTKSGLLDGNVISINFDDKTSTILKDGSYINGAREEDLFTSINNIVSPIKTKSEQVLVTLDKVLGSLRLVFNEKGTQNLTNSVVDLSGALHALRLTSESLNKIVNENGNSISKTLGNVQLISNNLAKNNDEINKTIKNFGKLSDSLANSDIKSTIENLSVVTKELALITSKMNKGEGSLGKMINDQELYDNLNKSTKELNLLLKDMQRYPGRYVNVSVFGGPSKKAEIKREKDLKSGTYKPE